MTDRLDQWQQYLNDIQKVDDERTASKESKAELKQRVRDRRDDLLLGLNAKRALETSQDDDGDSDSDNIDNNTLESCSSRRSQCPVHKRC